MGFVENARAIKSPAWVRQHPEEVIADLHDMADEIERLQAPTEPFTDDEGVEWVTLRARRFKDLEDAGRQLTHVLRSCAPQCTHEITLGERVFLPDGQPSPIETKD